MPMKLCCSGPVCIGHEASNRIQELKLHELMGFIRQPTRKVPADAAAYWESTQTT